MRVYVITAVGHMSWRASVFNVSYKKTKKNPPNPVYFCPSIQKDTIKCLKLSKEHIWCL